MDQNKFDEALRIKAKLDQAKRWLECVHKSNKVEFCWDTEGIVGMVGLSFRSWSGFFRKDDYAMQEIFDQVKATAMAEVRKRIDRWEKAMEAL